MTKKKNELRHVAIIMDGNGRWASKRGMPRSVGHKKGATRVKEIARAAEDAGIEYLTLYAFSTENWQRSKEEVDSLMSLLRDYLKNDLKELQEKGVRLIFIGEREMLPADIIESIKKLETQTISNENMTLCVALSYGSRYEIVNAAKRIAQLVKKDDISIEDIDIKMFSDMLYTKDIPDPDLVIRTSGEQRISNYLLWQIAYSEFYFSEILWPDFDKKAFDNIIKDFNSKERRYGKA